MDQKATRKRVNTLHSWTLCIQDRESIILGVGVKLVFAMMLFLCLATACRKKEKGLEFAPLFWDIVTGGTTRSLILGVSVSLRPG